MPQLLTGEELMRVFSEYKCQKQVHDQLVSMIERTNQEHGRVRTLIITEDRRSFVLNRLKTRYFDAAFDFSWIRAPKIIKPGSRPEMDTLNVGAIAAEELTEQEFSLRMDHKALKEVVAEAEKIINPLKPKT
jgi:hypothetical protein